MDEDGLPPALYATNVTANVLPIPILVYHQIAEAPQSGAPFRSLYVSPCSFRAANVDAETVGLPRHVDDGFAAVSAW